MLRELRGKEHDVSASIEQKSPVAIRGLSEIANRYDAFILDQWGVLHDGIQVYPGTRTVLTEVRATRKPLIIITNSSKTNERNEARLDTQFGLPASLYTRLVSSAHILRSLLIKRNVSPFDQIGDKLYIVAVDSDELLFVNTPLRHVRDVNAADAIVLLSVRPGENETQHMDWMTQAIKRGLLLLSPSADLFSVTRNGVVTGLSAIVKAYANAGGTAFNIGKPERFVYDECNIILEGINPHRVLAIGDQIGSDCLGAHRQGFDALLVLTGAAGETFAGNPISATADVIRTRFPDVPIPQWIMPSLEW